jgi:hypothetical protein
MYLPSALDEVGLVQLRKRLQDAGLRDEERPVTYAIEHATASGKLKNAWGSVAQWIHPSEPELRVLERQSAPQAQQGSMKALAVLPALGHLGSFPIAAIGYWRGARRSYEYDRV